MDSVFFITSPRHRNVSKTAILSLMKLQNIATPSDYDACRVAQLAAVGGASRWKRNGTRLVLDEGGALTHDYSPGAVESDVMLCIVCVLLTFIVTTRLQ
jgi:hypothetical protein